MGTTLEGKQINQTYQGLLKTTDNNEIGASAKEITDGKGNGTGVSLDNSGNLSVNNNVTANAFIGDGSQLTNLPSAPIESVNAKTGIVVLNTDDIAQGVVNEYYTEAKVSANSSVAANTAKVGITTEQANAIVANSAKVGITEQQASDILTNNAKVGITEEQSNAITANTAKVGITTAQADAIVANTAKNSYPSDDATKLAGIEANADVTDATNVAAAGALMSGTAVISDLNDVASTTPTDGQVLTYDTTNGWQPETPTSGGAVNSVNGQTGTVVLDTDDINEGTTNLYYTEARVSANTDVAANTAKVGITTQQASDIVTNNAKVSFDSASSTKLAGIEDGAQVNVQSDWNAVSGDALILNKPTLFDGAFSSLTGTPTTIAGYGITDALQLGTTSTTALAGDTTTITAQQASDITANNAKISFDSASSTKLAGIEAGAEVNPTASEIKTSYESNLDTNAFTDAEKTKLSGIASGAEVNVNADWNATTGDAQILNKPTLATVATTGAYSDLSGTPTLATVATSGSYTDLINQPTIPTDNSQLANGAGYITDGNTGWDNTYGFITASSTDTLTNKSGNNSQWTNDAGYINAAAQTIHTNAIGKAIDFSARVTLDNGVAEGTSGIIKNLQNIM